MTITWSASGTVGHPGDDSTAGGSWTVGRNYGAQNGIGDLSAPIDSLIGVFVSGSTGTPFFMGASGTLSVPAGVTAFYLGTMDGYGWANNTGAFDVTVTAVPEPATCLAGLLILAPFGVSTLRRIRRNRE